MVASCSWQKTSQTVRPGFEHCSLRRASESIGRRRDGCDHTSRVGVSCGGCVSTVDIGSVHCDSVSTRVRENSAPPVSPRRLRGRQTFFSDASLAAELSTACKNVSLAHTELDHKRQLAIVSPCRDGCVDRQRRPRFRPGIIAAAAGRADPKVRKVATSRG